VDSLAAWALMEEINKRGRSAVIIGYYISPMYCYESGFFHYRTTPCQRRKYNSDNLVFL